MALPGEIRIRRYAPVPVVLGGLILSILFYRIGYTPFVGPIAGTALGGMIGAGILWLKPGEIHRPFDSRISAIVISLYVVLMIGIYRFSAVGTRPTLHYVLFGAVAAFIAYQTLRGGSAQVIIPQIVVLAFFTYWASQWAFPAGMFGPDTRGNFIPAVNGILAGGSLTPDMTYNKTPGHMIFVASILLATGLETQVGYYLTMTLCLVSTIPLFALLQRAPGLDERTIVLAALLFATSGFIIGRGVRPNKLNVYYPLIMLMIGVTIHGMYRGQNWSAWVTIAVATVGALVFGHMYSTGAAGFLVLALVGFAAISRSGLLDHEGIPKRSAFSFGIIIAISLIGYSIAGGNGIIKRLARVTASLLVIFSGGAGGGSAGGRYADLPLEVLLGSTMGATLFFVFGVAGVVVGLRKRMSSVDMLVGWILACGGLLTIGLFASAANLSPARIYSLLALFGFNVLGALAITRLGGMTRRRIVTAAVAIGIFASVSLAAPTASVALSIYSEDITHFKKFNRVSEMEGSEWVDKYGDEVARMQVPHTEVPVKLTSPSQGVVDRSAMEPGMMYAYKQSAQTGGAGLRLGGGERFGSGQYAFVMLPPDIEHDDQVYANGRFSVYRRSAGGYGAFLIV